MNIIKKTLSPPLRLLTLSLLSPLLFCANASAGHETQLQDIAPNWTWNHPQPAASFEGEARGTQWTWAKNPNTETYAWAWVTLKNNVQCLNWMDGTSRRSSGPGIMPEYLADNSLHFFTDAGTSRRLEFLDDANARAQGFDSDGNPVGEPKAVTYDYYTHSNNGGALVVRADIPGENNGHTAHLKLNLATTQAGTLDKVAVTSNGEASSFSTATELPFLVGPTAPNSANTDIGSLSNGRSLSKTASCIACHTTEVNPALRIGQSKTVDWKAPVGKVADPTISHKWFGADDPNDEWIPAGITGTGYDQLELDDQADFLAYMNAAYPISK